MNKDFLVSLKSHPEWEFLLKEILKARPQIPTYTPSRDNTEEWKVQCLRREGFDIWLTLLEIEND